MIGCGWCDESCSLVSATFEKVVHAQEELQKVLLTSGGVLFEYDVTLAL